MPTEKIPQITLNQNTKVPLGVVIALCLSVLGGTATYINVRMAKAEERLDQHAESLHDKDKRLALVERAVLSLEKLAAAGQK
jgi:hypothetical protein